MEGLIRDIVKTLDVCPFRIFPATRSTDVSHVREAREAEVASILDHTRRQVSGKLSNISTGYFITSTIFML